MLSNELILEGNGTHCTHSVQYMANGFSLQKSQNKSFDGPYAPSTAACSGRGLQSQAGSALSASLLYSVRRDTESKGLTIYTP